MKRRGIAWTLTVLLCANLLLSGILLVLHMDHTCHSTACTICIALAQSVEHFLAMIAILAAVGLYCDVQLYRCYGPPENRFDPGWTLVRQKVKLLD